MIWNRYILKEFLLCFVSFLLCFNFLYIIIDYTNHIDTFYFDKQFHWKVFTTYYACDLLHRFTAIAPFLLLLSCIKVVSDLVMSNELLAMMASGRTIKKLLSPLIAVALTVTLLTYLNLEFVHPKAIQTMDKLSSSRKKTGIRQMTLKDRSILLFQKYDTSRGLFQDLYWIRNTSDIYHIKTLSHDNKYPTGTFVDHFKRNKKGELVKAASAKEQEFPEMRLNMRSLREIITLPEDESLSKLWKKLPKERHPYLNEEAQVLAAFYHKLVIPWLCLLAVIAPIPFCLNFSRKVPLFAIYAGSLFGLIAFALVLGTAFLLGKRQTLDPFLATAVPFTTLFSYFSWRYVRLT